MLNDVVRAAWKAVGAPPVVTKPSSRSGQCARCGAAGRLAATRQVVSRNFTAFSGWHDPGGFGLCNSCVWAYRHPMLRTIPHLIHRWPEMTVPLRATELRSELARPLSDDRALVVPLRVGRKHPVGHAQWGRIATDDVCLSWTAEDAARLSIVDRLRTAGVTMRELHGAAPPYRVVAKLPATQLRGFLSDWNELDPWRQRPLWLQLAARTEPPRAWEEPA